MRETPEEVAALADLMARSYARSTDHLKSIIHGERQLTAEQVVAGTTGMRVLSLATVTRRGEPRISAVDGHFLHGTWTFGTAGDSAKARHLEERPAVSVAYVDGERVGVFAHGNARLLTPQDPAYDETFAHWTAYYDSDPRTWGPDIRMYRLEPTWLVAYSAGPTLP